MPISLPFLRGAFAVVLLQEIAHASQQWWAYIFLSLPVGYRSAWIEAPRGLCEFNFYLWHVVLAVQCLECLVAVPAECV